MNGDVFKSGMERRFAEELREAGVDYKYENTRFNIAPGKTYLPDFFIESIIVEVKGRVRGDDKEKARLFMDEFGDDYLYLVVGDANIHEMAAHERFDFNTELNRAINYIKENTYTA